MRFFRVARQNVQTVVDEIASSRKPIDVYVDYVRKIVEDVKTRGDEALMEYARRFDSSRLTIEDILVPRKRLAEAYNQLDDRARKALRKAAENISKLCSSQLRRLSFVRNLEQGVKVVLRPAPLHSVGCYVPGGLASYPSTALMTVVPAKVAGVPRVVVCTPPTSEGLLNDAVLAALYVAGADEVYAVGGPHAVAAMAYGTETVRRVEKIVGPGGPYVTAAKKVVSGDVPVDMLAGPTELLVFGDDVRDAEDIALEMCAQAEHSEDTLVGLATTSDELANEVLKYVKLIASRLERGKTIESSLEKNGYVAVCDSLTTVVELVQSLAPEHFFITSKPDKIAPYVSNAGLMSVGRYTSPALCDYVVGVNHVLPTSGQARVRGGLSVLDYVKLATEVRVLKGAAKRLGRHAAVLARAEGLTAHAAAAGRLLDEKHG
ncbi:MAG: histidinol dehydrogenase [Candidatus Caldarchaeum sp.]|nr:histidinol dehydrogenase [Candidatus Caldarchaeum sp.]